MKLDRNVNLDGKGKYALINIRKLDSFPLICGANVGQKFYLVPVETVEWGNTPETEFFVIKLKDENAGAALLAYSQAVLRSPHPDPEFANEVYELAMRSGPLHPLCKKPD